MAWGKKKGEAAPSAKAGGMSFDPPADVAPDATAQVADEADAPPGDVQPVAAEEASPPPSAAIAAVPAAASATSRFGRRSATKAVKPPKAPKEPKAAKVRRARKASKDEVRSVEDYPMPVMMVIEFYEGLTKEREAEQLGRALIEKNFDAPNASYVYTQPWRKGIAVEVQEGGGQAYLPEILQKLDEDPEAVIAVPMSNRIAQVRLDAETGRLEMLLLLNNQEPPASAFVPLPSKPMKPFDRRGSRLFIAGIALLASTVIASVFSVGAFFIDTEAWALPYVQQTDVKSVPMSQLAQMKEAAARGDCLFKMEFAGGSWTMTTGYDSGGVCSRERPAAPAAGAVDGAIDPAAALPGQPGLPGAVPAIPGAAPSGAFPGASTPGVPSAFPAPSGATPPVSATPPAVPAG